MRKISSFKDRFKQALELSEKTAADISRITKISEATISKYRNGYQEPKVKNLESIARILHVNSLWLMGYDEPMDTGKGSTIERNLADEQYTQYEMYCDSILELPPEQQQMVYDYIDFLFVKYKKEQEEYIRSIIPEE